MTTALLEADFEFDPQNPAHRESGNATRYTVYHLPYQAKAAGEGALRPEIKIETAVWPLRLPSIHRSVASFLAQAFNRPPEVPSIPCVALPPRPSRRNSWRSPDVPGQNLSLLEAPATNTLPRHVYDLHVIRPHYNVTEILILAREIMRADVEAYGHQFPAYRENPVAETIRVVRGLPTDEHFAESYAIFLRDMVYGETPDFQTALATLSALADILAA